LPELNLTVSRGWSWLTEPSPHLKDPKKRRDARLLATLLLSSFMLLMIIPLAQLLGVQWDDGETRLISVSVALVILISGYVLCRLGFLQLMYAVLFGGMMVVCVGTGIARGETGVANLYYCSLLVVCAALAVSNALALITAIVSTIGILYFGSQLPSSTDLLPSIQETLIFLWIVTPLTMLFTHYRTIAENERAKQLAISEERYRFISETISDYAFKSIYTPDGGTISEWMTEEAFERVSGYSFEEWKKRGRFFQVVPEDLPRVLSDIERLRVTGEGNATEYRITTRAGKVRWLMVSRRPVKDDTGKVTGFYGVAQDITEQKLIEAAKRDAATLQTAFEKEREMNETKNKMMMTISHEFRTPLAEIRVASDLLLNYYDRLTPEGRKEKLSAIQSRIAHLNGMLEDVQMIMTSANSSATIRYQPIDIDPLCAQAAQAIQQEYKETHQIIYRGTPGTIIRADISVLIRAVDSLLTNAVKYSPNGGEITLEVGVEDKDAVIRVRDHGIGIPDDEQSKVFQPFYRASNSDHIEGMGFGLTIVKDCADLHGGSVELESKPGEGSCFTLRLPLLKSEAR
jgi:PAS domain S-box-containing protein